MIVYDHFPLPVCDCYAIPSSELRGNHLNVPTLDAAELSSQEALTALNQCVSVSVIQQPNFNLRKERSGRSLEYLSVLGISEVQLKQLNVIHVAGSKGKGSTCAVIEHVLRNLGFKTGFISSPHLINVEERIRINGKPIDRDLFTDTFWAVNDQVTTYAKESGSPKPGYLHYIILMAFKAFIEQKVDVAVVEVGLGGRYDHTNFFSAPALTVVTSLYLEHTSILGNTLAEIAWRKAGIFKPHCYAVVSRGQADEVMQVFEEEAKLVKCPLFVAPSADQIKILDSHNTLASVVTEHMANETSYRSLNIGLSLAAIDLWLRYRNGITSDAVGLQPEMQLNVSQEIVNAALHARWPGRWQKISRKNAVYYIDGAHTEDSLKSIAEWFQSDTNQMDSNPTVRILIFTVLGPRDPKPMLNHLHQIVRPGFDFVLFADPHPPESVYPKSKTSQHEQCLSCWQSLNSNDAESHPKLGSFEDLVRLIDWLEQAPRVTKTHLMQLFGTPTASDADPPPLECSAPTRNGTDHPAGSNVQCRVLTTGSLYIVGAVLKALNVPV